MLIERRDKIKRIYLTQVNPIVNPRLDAQGLTFENAAVAGGVAKGPVGVPRVVDALRQHDRRNEPFSETKSATTTIAAPSGLPSSGFIAVDISADSDDVSVVEAAGACLFPPGGRRLEAGRARPSA